jgi:hypothetical protein
MLRRIRARLSYANVVATAALFVALGGGAYAVSGIPSRGVFHGCVSNSTGVLRVVTSARACHRVVRNGPHRNSGEFAISWNQHGAQGLPGLAGAQGVQGPPGQAGPSFGDSIQVRNKEDLACNTENVLGQETITVSRPSRILAFGNGALSDDGAATTTYGLWLRLRDAADANTLAITSAAWDFDDGNPVQDLVMPLSVTSMLMGGTSPETFGPTYVALPGTYQLQLIAFPSEGTCTTALPDFGVNQGGGMGYAILGNG